MKKFLKTIFLFMLPVLMVVGLFSTVLVQSGELVNTEIVAKKMANGEDIFLGLAYRDDTRSVKQFVAASNQADILVLGTSRSMQFRGAFFETNSFYNAGGAIAYLADCLPFLQSLPQKNLPTHLVLVLDQYFYNESWSAQGAFVEQKDYLFEAPNFGSALWKSMQDYASGKYSVLHILQTPEHIYGMAAAGRASGFYTDGSYSYGAAVLHPEQGLDFGFRDSYQRIFLGTNRFEFGTDVSQLNLDETEALLSFCAEHGIQVTAILPPYAPSVYAHMEGTGNYTYIDKLLPALRPIFTQYGFEIFNYTFLEETTDAQYVDGFHGSDRVYAAIAARLADDSALLSPYLNKSYLTELFYKEGNPLTINFEE